VSHNEFSCLVVNSLFFVGLCHHGMARPLVADGGDGLQIWISSVSSHGQQTEWSSNFWGWTGVKNSLTKYYTGPRTWTNAFEQTMQQKIDVRFGMSPRETGCVIWLRVGTLGGLLWTPKWTSEFHKRREFLDQLSGCWLLNKYSPPMRWCHGLLVGWLVRCSFDWLVS
jgi:hypothetical protein